MTEIRRLPESTIRTIAAGEVVERPASVVKELLENSLDADAGRIDIEVEAGETGRIRVADDGVGMDREAARLAVEEHTTSKLPDEAGLESGVTTLGFRGEALYAIGAVATVEITTCPRGRDEGTRLVVEHGDVTAVEPAGRAPGTTVEVTGLFAEMPARKKFLKTEATEFDHVNGMATRYALANPDVAISLAHGDREVFATDGRDDRRATILSVYGREVAESMRPLPDEGPVSGAVSDPETTRSTRDYVSTFVNGRYVTSTLLREAIVSAYGKQLAPDRYPFAVVFCDMPTETVDVNVHPRKLEVRFDDPAAVRETVRDAVEEALLEAGLVRRSAPRGRSQPDEATIEPDANETEADGTGGDTVDPDVTKSGRAKSSRAAPGNTSEHEATPDSTGASPNEVTTGDEPGDDIRRGVDELRDTKSAAGPPTGPDGSELSTDANRPRYEGLDSDRKFRDPGRQATLDSDATDIRIELDRLPPMRIMGQLEDTYVVGATDSGLILIDQHAADERINYERLCARVAEDPASQALTEPVEVELTAREMAAVPAYEAALESIGFRAHESGANTVAVEAVPAVLGGALDPDLLRDVLVEFLGGDTSETTSADRRADALLADLACYPSITGNTPLTDGSTQALLRKLDSCENPYACPHGRPVVIEFGTDEIADRFERDYPGHAGRREP